MVVGGDFHGKFEDILMGEEEEGEERPCVLSATAAQRQGAAACAPDPRRSFCFWYFF
jgi:hypothetical protein